MQKIDRLGWAAGVCFESFGLTIGVRVNASEVPTDLLGCMPPFWRPLQSPFVDHLLSVRLGGNGPRPGSKNFFLVHSGLTQIARTLDRQEALAAVENELQMHVAAHARDRVFVHAGVVEWQGRAIVLPGRSFAGKSTLVNALLNAGATYYSDEFAVLDGKGRVYPYPRRLSLRQSGDSPMRFTAADLGADTGIAPIPVGKLIFTEYRPSANWRPKLISPARALFELVSNTLPNVSQSRFGRRVLEQLAESLTAIQSRRSDADQVAEEILHASERTQPINDRLLLARAA